MVERGPLPPRVSLLGLGEGGTRRSSLRFILSSVKGTGRQANSLRKGKKGVKQGGGWQGYLKKKNSRSRQKGERKTSLGVRKKVWKRGGAMRDAGTGVLARGKKKEGVEKKNNND